MKCEACGQELPQKPEYYIQCTQPLCKNKTIEITPELSKWLHHHNVGFKIHHGKYEEEYINKYKRGDC